MHKRIIELAIAGINRFNAQPIRIHRFRYTSSAVDTDEQVKHSVLISCKHLADDVAQLSEVQLQKLVEGYNQALPTIYWDKDEFDHVPDDALQILFGNLSYSQRLVTATEFLNQT